MTKIFQGKEFLSEFPKEKKPKKRKQFFSLVFSEYSTCPAMTSQGKEKKGTRKKKNQGQINSFVNSLKGANMNTYTPIEQERGI